MSENQAGPGSKVNPEVPVYKDSSGYKPAEKINAGLMGGSKGKVDAGHGQNSDAPGEHNKLWPETLELRDPYRAKPGDFPVADVNSGDGQSGPHGMATGQNELIMDSENQCGPRHTEDDGPGSGGSGTPVPADRGAVVARNFKIGMNKGEGSSDTGMQSAREWVNLQTGHIEGPGSNPVVETVPESSVSIG